MEIREEGARGSEPPSGSAKGICHEWAATGADVCRPWACGATLRSFDPAHREDLPDDKAQREVPLNRDRGG